MEILWKWTISLTSKNDSNPQWWFGMVRNEVSVLNMLSRRDISSTRTEAYKDQIQFAIKQIEAYSEQLFSDVGHISASTSINSEKEFHTTWSDVLLETTSILNFCTALNLVAVLESDYAYLSGKDRKDLSLNIPGQIEKSMEKLTSVVIALEEWRAE